MHRLRRRPPLVRSLIWGLLGLCLSSFPAQAAISGVTYSLTFDGQSDAEGGFDPSPGPGYDTGANNQIVRTNDVFEYTVGLSYTGTETGITVVATLPRGDVAPRVGQIVAEWAYLPPYCKTGSTLSADKQTLTCVIGDVTATTGTGTTSLVMDARVLSTTPNGTSLPAPTMTITSTSSAVPAPASLPPTVTVSAAPFYDVVIANSYPGNPKAYAYFETGGPNNEEGFYHRPLVGLVARNPNGNGRKGVEQLATDVNFNLDISGYPSTVRVDNWHTGTGPAGTPAATGSFQDGCGSPGYGSPSAGAPSSESGSTVNIYDRVADTGPATGSNASTVPNGGDCAVTGSSATTVNLKVTGADTSLTARPTVLAGTGTPIPQREWWVMNKALVLWTPLTSYPAGVATNNTLKLGSYSATSISGQAITGNDTANDTLNYPITAVNGGVASKIFARDDSRPYPYGTECDPALTGNCLTNFMSPGQTVRTNVRYGNEGVYKQSNVYLCDIIDRTAFDIGTNFKVVPTGTGTVRYGARASSPYFASTDATETGNAVNASGAPGTNGVSSAYSSAKCDDTSIRWFSTVAEAQAAGGLVYVRFDVPQVSGGTAVSMDIYGLTLRSTYAATINVLSGQPGTRSAGSPLAEGTLIRNTADFGGTGVASIDQNVFWDNLKVVPIKTRSAVTKTVLDPAADPVSTDAVLTYQIQPTFTTTFPPLARNFTVTDILPPGLSYVPGSATVGGVGREPTISNNAPAAGFTRLTWVYPNQLPYVLAITPNDAVNSKLPPIVFRAAVSPTAANNSTLTNSVAVSGGPDDYDTDCTYNTASTSYGACPKASSVSRTVQSAPGLKLSKTTPVSQIELGEPFQFTLNYVSVGSNVTARDLPDLIDILPYNGDGKSDSARKFTGRKPASAFSSGAYELQSVRPPASDPGMAVFYTKAAPTTINLDPQDVSNAQGGSTVWCAALSGGSCPASMAEVTAVRLRPSVMNANVTYSVDLNFQTTAAAKLGDIFNNSVGMRPTDPNSSLLFLEAQAVSAVRVLAASIGGRVFEDVNQNGGFDTTDKGIAGVCVVVTGTTSRGAAVTSSAFSQADGTYFFGAGAAGTVFPSADCTGTALSSFSGLQSGTYSVREQTQPSGYLDGKDYAGTSGGTASNDQVTGVALKAGSNATGYNFTEVQPRLAIAKGVDTTHIRVVADPDNDTTLTVLPETRLVTYTLTVTNSTAIAVSSATVTDTLPTGLTYVSSSSPATVDGQTVTLVLDNLAAGEIRKIALTTRATVTANANHAPYLNTATLAFVGMAPLTSNQVRTDVVYTKLTKRVQNLGASPGAEVPRLPADWQKVTYALPGETLEYCIDFYNHGSTPLENYVLSDRVPTHTTLVPGSWAVRQGTMTAPGAPLTNATLSATGEQVQARIPRLAPGSTGTLCFRANIN